MNSESIRTFLMLAKVKNFTRTAEKLYVAQSTVTNRILELENETGKKLFVRKQGGVELTEEGMVFLDYAQRIGELEDALMQEINRASRNKKALKIGTINAVYESGLYPAISRFMREKKDYTLKVTLSHSMDMFQLLQDKIIDVAFSYVPLKKAGYECVEMYSDRLALYASPQINAYKNGIRKEELEEVEYLLCNFAYGDVGVYIMGLFPLRHTFAFEIDNSGKLIRYLKDGLGYSFLPERLAKDAVLSGELEEVRLKNFVTPRLTTYCAYRKGNSAAEEFLKVWREENGDQSE